MPTFAPPYAAQKRSRLGPLRGESLRPVRENPGAALGCSGCTRSACRGCGEFLTLGDPHGSLNGVLSDADAKVYSSADCTILAVRNVLRTVPDPEWGYSGSILPPNPFPPITHAGGFSLGPGALPPPAHLSAQAGVRLGYQGHLKSRSWEPGFLTAFLRRPLPPPNGGPSFRDVTCSAGVPSAIELADPASGRAAPQSIM